VINQGCDLLIFTQIDRQNRPITAHGTQRLNPAVTPTITTGHSTTLDHERPPLCWDIKPVNHIRRTLSIFKQPDEVFLRVHQLRSQWTGRPYTAYDAYTFRR
jgi:hypothetical protein